MTIAGTTKPKAVTVPLDAGTKWWQHPDALWRKSERVRRARLRTTVAHHILPTVAAIEALLIAAHPGWRPKFTGRTMAEIEADPEALEWGIAFFDLAVDARLIGFRSVDGKPVRVGKGGKSPVGACGLSVAEARALFIKQAGEAILDNAGHKLERLRQYLSAENLREVGQLQRLRLLVQFDPLSVDELIVGLKKRIRDLLDKPPSYLMALKACSSATLRVLRRALGDKFAGILDWTPAFIDAVAVGLGHGAKIKALGPSLLAVENPAVLVALGTWPMKEVVENDAMSGTKKRTYKTRIEKVRRLLGNDFERLLRGSPKLVEIAGGWSDEQLDRMKLYLEYLESEVLDRLSPLSDGQRLDVLDGLWDKLGRKFFEDGVNTPPGLGAVANLVAEIQTMAARGTTPKDLRAMIAGDFFDKHLIRFLRNR